MDFFFSGYKLIYNVCQSWLFALSILFSSVCVEKDEY